MRILLVHNHYQWPGGEDAVFFAERDLLLANGHDVRTLTVHNERISRMPTVAVAAATLWSQDGYRRVKAEIQRHRPDIMHVHNTFPLLSPAVFHAAHAEGVPVVYTLHNFRLVCPAATLFREGTGCRDCLGRTVAWPGVAHACYQGSRLRTAGVAAMLVLHKSLGTWATKVTRFIVMTEFARRLLREAAVVPDQRVVVKPHFVPTDPGIGSGGGGFALFVGRLAREKGLETLFAAWHEVGGLPLKVVGDGPLAPLVREASATQPSVEWLGQRSHAEVLELLGAATVLVFPSPWYETFGLVLIEAFARGTPVIAARAGGTAEIVEEGKSGLLFEPGDASELAGSLQRMLASPSAYAYMRHEARQRYVRAYTADENHNRLLEIYRSAIAG